jgi:hypothetical protein
MHDQQIRHNSGVAVEQRKLEMGEPIPLFRAYLNTDKGLAGGVVRYSIGLQVHTLRMRNGRQRFPKHVEQVPSWQDVLVCDLDSDLRLRAMWVSSNPDWQDVDGGAEVTAEQWPVHVVALPDAGRTVLGEKAELRFLPFDWNYWWDAPLAAPIEREALTRLPDGLLARLWAGDA